MMMTTQDSGGTFDSQQCILAPGVNLGFRKQTQVKKMQHTCIQATKQK